MNSNWTIGNHLNFYATIASSMSIPNALYEFIKNLEDEDAKKGEIICDINNKRIFICGDSTYTSPESLEEIRTNIANSNKSERNHGLGLLSFLRLGRRMVMISYDRKTETFSITSCAITPDDKNLTCDVEQAHIMQPDEIARYGAACNHLRRWNSGFVTVIEKIGEGIPHYNLKFKFEEEFENKKIINPLSELIAWSPINCYFKYGDNKTVLIKKKQGTGKLIDIKLPSKEYPCLKGTEPIYCFEYNNFHYNIKLHLKLWISINNEGKVRIAENGQDVIDIKDAFKNKISKLSYIFKDHEFSNYLQGCINFKIESTDKGPAPVVYNSSRQQLIIEGSFGDCLANMLMYVDIEILREIITKYREQTTKRSDEKNAKELSEDMDDLFKDHPEIFDRYLQHSTGKPDASNLKRCSRCGTEAIPIRGYTYDEIFPLKEDQKGKIIAPSDRKIYVCTTCGKTWDRGAYTKPINEPEIETEKQRPLPKWTEPSIGKERQRKHGYGYKFDIRPLTGIDQRATLIGIELVVNSNHSSYKSLIQTYGKNDIHIKIYERQMALKAIIKKTYSESDPKNLHQIYEDGDADILLYYNPKLIKKAHFRSKKEQEQALKALKEKFENR